MISEAEFQAMLSRNLAEMRGESPDVVPQSTPRTATASNPQKAPYTAIQRRRGPNKWESDYAATELEPRRLVGDIAWYGFESIKLKLADATYYTPDFVVMLSDGRIEFREVKGFVRDDAVVKFKVAAAQFPFRFTMLRKKRVSEGGGWEVMRDLNTSADDKGEL